MTTCKAAEKTTAAGARKLMGLAILDLRFAIAGFDCRWPILPTADGRWPWRCSADCRPAQSATAIEGKSQIASPPHLRFSELLQEQFLERGVGADAEETRAAPLAELAQALDEVLDGLLIGLEAITAESDFLQSAGFRVHQAELAVSQRVQ